MEQERGTVKARSRIDALDSLRGLAALSVVIHHSLLVFTAFYLPYAVYPPQTTGTGLMNWLTYSPLHIIWGGRESVMLFFVLSGFVLYLPYRQWPGIDGRKASPTPYPNYLAKRICRIYLPYIFVIGLSCILLPRLSSFGVYGLSDWFNGMWSHPVSLGNIVDYILMFPWDSHNINTATWSLGHEMRISVVFPLIALFVRSRSALSSIILALAVSLLPGRFLPLSDPYLRVMTESCYYAGFFVLGALLAKNQESIKAGFSRCSVYIKVVMLIASFAVFNWKWEFFGVPHLNTMETVDWAMGVGASALICFSFSSVRIGRLLSKRPLVWLGRISYSLYLIHALVILTLIYTLRDYLPIPFIVTLVLPVSLALAAVMNRLIEAPSISLGHLADGCLRKHSADSRTPDISA